MAHLIMPIKNGSKNRGMTDGGVDRGWGWDLPWPTYKVGQGLGCSDRASNIQYAMSDQGTVTGAAAAAAAGELSNAAYSSTEGTRQYDVWTKNRLAGNGRYHSNGER